MEQRAEAFWELVKEERLVRVAAMAALGLVWLAAAWRDVAPLVALVFLAVAVALLRRYRHAAGHAPVEDDPDLY